MRCKIGNQTLICGNCVEVMSLFPAESVDCIITSPPYNLGIKYNSYDDNLEIDEYLRWAKIWLHQSFRVLNTNGSFFLNISGSSTSPRLPGLLSETAISSHFILQNSIVWVKSIYVPGATHVNDRSRKTGDTFGHFKPINSNRYLNRTNEMIYHFTKTGKVNIHRLDIGVDYVDSSNLTRWKRKSRKRCRGNTWMIPYDTRNAVGKHPATFPVELALNCMDLHFGTDSNKWPNERMILDMFSGYGTTNVAAQKRGHPCVGIEIDKGYYEDSRQRLLYLRKEQRDIED